MKNISSTNPDEIAEVEADGPAARVDQLQALHRIAVAMSGSLNVGQIIRIVLTEIMELTRSPQSTLYLLNLDSQQLLPRLTLGDVQTVRPLDLQTDNDLAVQVAHTAMPDQVVIEAPSCNDLFEAEKPFEGPLCRLCVPMLAGDQLFGVVDIHVDRCTAIDQGMQDLLVTMASLAAQVLSNAQTHEELEHHYRELTLLYEIQQEISSTLELDKVLSLVVNRTRSLMEGCECVIKLIKKTGKIERLTVVASTSQNLQFDEIDIDQSSLDQMVMGGDTLAIDDVQNHPQLAGHAANLCGLVSLLIVPLVARRQTLGTLHLYTADRREFTETDRKMLLAVAGQAATAIDHAHLYYRVEQQNRDLVASNTELRKTQKQLVQKEKLAALGEMAATVAHEIRNPLTSIRGYAQRISRKYDGETDGKLSGYTRIIIEEVDRLNNFIRDVLDFARRVKPELDSLNINRILSEVLNLMRDEFTVQTIAVIPDLDMQLQPIIGDEALLKQVFLNIFQNARQAMNKGGVLMIRTQNRPGEIRIRIADDGHGIPRDVLSKIFTPFYTTKVHGTGLGLSVIHRVIDDHQGRITVRSRVGTGTIVDITLPTVQSG